MARTPSPLPPELRSGAFRTSRASTSIDPNRFRRGDLVALTRGVRAPNGAAGDELERVRGFGLVLGTAQRLSHVSAARMWEMPLPGRFEQRHTAVHVTTAGGGALMRRTGVVAHRDRVGHRATSVRGVSTSDPVSTWYECRALLSVTELVVLGDHIVGPAAFATVDDLRRACRAGDRGVRRARLALERIRVGAESPMESRFRLIVVDRGFPEPELNTDVRDGRGTFLGRADMLWPGQRIVIEYDGDHHRTDHDTFHGDRRRGNGFAVNGWLVLRVTARDARDPGPVIQRLREAFAARGHRVDTP